MDPTKLLETDHRQAEDLFDRIEAADGTERPRRWSTSWPPP